MEKQKLALLSIHLILLLGLEANAQSLLQNTPPQVPQIAYQASRIPDRILLTIADENAHDRIVTWRTLHPEGSKLQLSNQPEAYDFYRSPEKLGAETDLLLTLQGDTAYYHKVHLQNLEQNKSYTYRVGDGTIWSEWLVFESYPEHA